jgi:anti-sigma factor RsiW
MQKPSDETLIAYLDGELDAAQRGEVESLIESDPALRERAVVLAASAETLRIAFEPVLHEEIPERLLAAARGETVGASAIVVDFAAAQKARQAADNQAADKKSVPLMQRAWTRWAAAAGVAGLIVGASVGYFAGGQTGAPKQVASNSASQAASWLDNIAGYHKLFVNAGADDQGLVDVPANASTAPRKALQKLPPDVKTPNLKPWGLEFQGARYLIVEGQPATALYYTTDNQKLGPVTVVIGTTNKPDLAPTFDHRGDVNMLYWRHHGRAYALVGTADIGYLWNLSNDIEYQLDAI